jgi:SAM-dependent methyltransferase
LPGAAPEFNPRRRQAMSGESTGYRYEDKLWEWEELEKHLARVYSRPPARVGLALGLVEGREVLDLGCHLADCAFALARRGHRVTAADVDEDTLKIARRLHSHPDLEIVRVKGEGGLPFGDCAFDSVLLLEVLEHTRDPRGLVAEIHRVLRPGGHLVLSVPNAASYHTLARTLLLNLPRYFRRMEQWPAFAYDQRDHFFYWDPFTLYRLLNVAGFVYEEHRFSDNIGWVNFLARFIPPLGRVSTCFIIKVQKTS